MNPRMKEATFEAVTTCISAIKYLGIPEAQKARARVCLCVCLCVCL